MSEKQIPFGDGWSVRGVPSNEDRVASARLTGISNAVHAGGKGTHTSWRRKAVAKAPMAQTLKGEESHQDAPESHARRAGVLTPDKCVLATGGSGDSYIVNTMRAVNITSRSSS